MYSSKLNQHGYVQQQLQASTHHNKSKQEITHVHNFISHYSTEPMLAHDSPVR